MTSEQALQQIRTKIFTYPEEKAEQAMNVLHYLKARHMRQRESVAQQGPYSGLSRAELSKTRTCETDWY